ncbi:hypothetical protein SORBI_3008G008200 [Sorghum bicolor]|uniref:Uncharacterized protein n=1 Tax=Sorghum bicolor TaxID=4558 RepID=A0A1B6PAM9_SORBI|nr:hypothetical protein SORBI_3008G008200 [Sorghum bicolor]
MVRELLFEHRVDFLRWCVGVHHASNLITVQGQGILHGANTLMRVYVVFLCWSAIKSEPETSSYKKEKTSSGVNWITIISFIVELASVSVAAFWTGTDYKCIQFTNLLESENDIPYMGMVFSILSLLRAPCTLACCFSAGRHIMLHLESGAWMSVGPVLLST